jgi:HTH-type transcriptional regulator, sugar sensing transcriptional regulator
VSQDPQIDDFVRTLVDLGFSQYEARCYVGLVGPEPQTGYGVAKITGVPQPKVYEALRKLASRGAARELAGDPVRFAAVPPEDLLASLQSTFDQRLESAREASRNIAGTDQASNLELVERLTSLDQLIDAATEDLRTAERRVYLSASAAELKSLREPIEEAVGRDVDVVILSFGRVPFRMEGLRVFHHASTDGAVYRHHQARHLALVADSRHTVYGVAPDGRDWHAVTTSSLPIIAAVKSFIRHDIDMQQVYADFGPQLVDAYGPGLQGLEGYRRDKPSTAAPRSTDKARRRKAG